MSIEIHFENGELEWGILFLEVSNAVHQSAEEYELRGGWQLRSAFWGHFKVMGYLHDCSDIFKNRILVNDVENVTELAVLQTISFEK